MRRSRKTRTGTCADTRADAVAETRADARIEARADARADARAGARRCRGELCLISEWVSGATSGYL